MASTPSKPLLKDTMPDNKIPRLMSRRDALSDLLAGGGFVVQRTVAALDRVNRILSDENIQTLTATLNDVHAVTAELRERKTMVEDAQKALQDADEAVRQIGAVAKSGQALVEGDGHKTLEQLTAAAAEIQATSKQLRVILAKLDGPTETFATTGLPQLAATMESLQRATDHLDQVLGEVQTNPQGVISKAPAKQIEVKP